MKITKQRMKIPKAIHPLSRFYGINRGIDRAIDKASQRYFPQRIWINKRKGLCIYRAPFVWKQGEDIICVDSSIYASGN